MVLGSTEGYGAPRSEPSEFSAEGQLEEDTQELTAHPTTSTDNPTHRTRRPGVGNFNGTRRHRDM